MSTEHTKLTPEQQWISETYNMLVTLMLHLELKGLMTDDEIREVRIQAQSMSNILNFEVSDPDDL